MTVGIGETTVGTAGRTGKTIARADVPAAEPAWSSASTGRRGAILRLEGGGPSWGERERGWSFV